MSVCFNILICSHGLCQIWNSPDIDIVRLIDHMIDLSFITMFVYHYYWNRPGLCCSLMRNESIHSLAINSIYFWYYVHRYKILTFCFTSLNVQMRYIKQLFYSLKKTTGIFTQIRWTWFHDFIVNSNDMMELRKACH